MPTIVPATEEHAEELAGNLRQSDIDEIDASIGIDPRVSLPASVMCSDEDMRWVALNDDGKPFCLWGVAPHHPEENLGVVWLVASDELQEQKIYFLKRCEEYIEKMHSRYPILHNWVDSRNELSMSWLEWCGFTVIDFEMEFGQGGMPFYHFARVQEDV